MSLINCQYSLIEFKFRARLTFSIVILARIRFVGMYFAYLLVKAEANKRRQSRTNKLNQKYN